MSHAVVRRRLFIILRDNHLRIGGGGGSYSLTSDKIRRIRLETKRLRDDFSRRDRPDTIRNCWFLSARSSLLGGFISGSKTYTFSPVNTGRPDLPPFLFFFFSWPIFCGRSLEGRCKRFLLSLGPPPIPAYRHPVVRSSRPPPAAVYPSAAPRRFIRNLRYRGTRR